MAAPIGLRDDFDGAALRALAKASRDPDQLRRILCLAEIYDGIFQYSKLERNPSIPTPWIFLQSRLITAPRARVLLA